MDPKETTVSVPPIQFIFAYNYSDNKEIDRKRQVTNPFSEFLPDLTFLT